MVANDCSARFRSTVVQVLGTLFNRIHGAHKILCQALCACVKSVRRREMTAGNPSLLSMASKKTQSLRICAVACLALNFVNRWHVYCVRLQTILNEELSRKPRKVIHNTLSSKWPETKQKLLDRVICTN